MYLIAGCSNLNTDMKLIKIILIIENRYCDFFIEELGDCEDCILFMLYKIIYFFFLLFIL